MSRVEMGHVSVNDDKEEEEESSSDQSESVSFLIPFH